MRRLLALCLAVALPAGAFECTKIEYAEVKDMTRRELDRRYCDVMGQSARNHAAAGRAANAGFIADSEKLLAEASACTNEAVRVLNVLEKKFKARAPKCETPQVQ